MLKRIGFSQAALTFAALLLAFALWSAPLSTHVREARQYLANAVVGVSASIPPNPSSALALQLAEREQELDEREAQLAALAREREDAPWALIALGTSILLFALVALNFYMDWRRGRKRPASESADRFAVNLRQR